MALNESPSTTVHISQFHVENQNSIQIIIKVRGVGAQARLEVLRRPSIVDPQALPDRPEEHRADGRVWVG